MTRLTGLSQRLRSVLRRGAVEAELDEEIRLHLDLETERNVALGMEPAEARRRALLAFGGVEAAKEAHRDGRGARWLEDLLADTRHALRHLRRRPVFALTAVATLTLGIAANLTIFSAVEAVILRPLPFADPDRLVMLWEENPEKDWHEQLVAPANALDWKDRVAAFADVALYNTGVGSATLTGEGSPRLLRSDRVTGNFFTVLGVPAELGRTLRSDETWTTGTHVAVLSHAAWVEHFARDTAIIGRTVRLEGEPVQIVGVMPAHFVAPMPDVDVWAPFEWNLSDRAQIWFRRAHWPRAVARLRPGITLEQADAQLQVVVRQLQHEYPETNRVMGAGLTPLHRFLIGSARRPLLVLLAAVSLLLGIACANVGNLLLVQAAGRERETALRLALGAGRSRIVRQAMAESLVLSAIGGAGGVALGLAGTRLLEALQPKGMLRLAHFGFDGRIFLYVLLVTVASGLAFGIVPALWSGRRTPGDALKEGGRGGDAGGTGRRWAERLVVAEVGLAVLLTLGAGLLVRSFIRLQQVNAGFDANGVLSAAIALPEATYDSTRARVFFDQLVEQTRGVPGVSDAALTSAVPLTGATWTSDFVIAGRPPSEFGSEVMHRMVSPGYFDVMRVPLLSGRRFVPTDRAGSPPVTLINDQLARQYFRGSNPVGQRIAFDRVPDSTSNWYTIVGVVGSERQRELASEPRIEAYFPAAQNPGNFRILVARTTADPAALGPSIRRVVTGLDPALAIASLRTMREVRTDAAARDRFLTTLMLLFAVVGVVLAVVGVYGVMAQLAQRRSHEMGIRLALGAEPSAVRWLVVRRGLLLVGIGLVAGVVVAAAATRGLAALLYEVAPADPATFIAVPLILAVAGLTAAWVPATHVSRVDPATTLRAD
jgi:putative ABC transport system permease protein